MKNAKRVMLSLDVEEFDTPLEYGKQLSKEEQFQVSLEGLTSVINLLDQYQITATLFTTASFALRFPELINDLSERFEIASHGYYHSSFDVKDLLNSRLELEKVISKPIHGYRMARMMPVDGDEIRKAGYVYNASLHPTYIPGRYNNLNKPRTYFVEHDVLQIPAAVTPHIRFPLFWLSFKNFPLAILKRASKHVMKKDGYVNIYFHPWEFTDTTDREKYGLPFYVSDNGTKMLNKLENYIQWCQKLGYSFCTYHDLYKSVSSGH